MAHPDLDTLLNAILPFAQQMLSQHGEFFPYGSVMKADGRIEAHAAYDGDEQPPPQRLIDMMTQVFRQQASTGQIRAAAICCDVRTVPPGQTEKTDAICVSMEHQSGQCADLYLPYKKGWLGKIQYGELFAAKRDPQFFIEGGRAT
jgi:hypothetical protein